MAAKTILIIDDDSDIMESIKMILETQGFDVHCAENKDEGLKKVKKVLPDLIIMDVMMEKMSDGFDLSRELKSDEKYKAIPIFMMTAIGEKTGYMFSDEGGDRQWLPIDDYAEKPLEPKELIARVKKLLHIDEKQGNS